MTGLRPVYQFFQVMQMRALEPLPVTRFNFDACMQKAGQLGGELAGMAGKRTPFASLEERLQWYDNLPYLNLGRLAERRLLADHAVASLSNNDEAPLALKLVESDKLAAAGRTEQMAAEVTRVYDAAVKAFEESSKKEKQMSMETLAPCVLRETGSPPGPPSRGAAKGRLPCRLRPTHP